MKLAVLKFGSSVLPDVNAFANAVHEVYQYLRVGYKVLVVVSAIGKTTDDLISTANHLINDPHTTPPAQALAYLLATGELAASSLFTIALDRAGIPAYKLDHRCLQTNDSYLDAIPLVLKTELIKNLFKQYSVVIIPGFIGTNSDNSITLLGRGGSDFSALFAAAELNADQCILYKDTAGIFNHDPKLAIINTKPYQTITYDDCLQLAYPVVQCKAIKFAKKRKLRFYIKTINNRQQTLVGAETSQLSHSIPIKKLRIVLLGLGTVGFGVYQHLIANSHLFEIVGIAVKNLAKHRQHQISETIISTNINEVIARDCDVVIELIGNVEISKQLITHALLQKRHVITANKALLAKYGDELAIIAAQLNVKLVYSAAVAGSVPVLENLIHLKKYNNQTIQSISGILNGTSNFILDNVRQGKSLSESIKTAQAAGFAEADPSLDINGTDAAQKLKILAKYAFNQEPKNINVAGIENINEDFIHNETKKNKFVRLIAECELIDGNLIGNVKPHSLTASHPLAHVNGADNCIVIKQTDGKLITLRGKGAGRWPTAESVYADLIALFLHEETESNTYFKNRQGEKYESLDSISTF